MNAITSLCLPQNEPVLNYAPNSRERKAVETEIKHLKAHFQEIPMIIDGEKITSSQTVSISTPHDHQKELGKYHYAQDKDINLAIASVLKAHPSWANTDMDTRAHIFLKAADLLATKYRAKINAATMLGQSKNIYQAEIDAACELIDFLRFNVYFMYQIYAQQPISSNSQRNIIDYRPLEGFVLAITPFNFTSIGGNLPTAPAIMGNTVIWKPSSTQILSAYVFMEVLMEAGLPRGVINLIYCDGPELSKIALNHPSFAGLHFTGSTHTFQNLWKNIGEHISSYHSYPRIVGETGGKDFTIIHSSANPQVAAVSLIRGAFEYQGQKCSATSRAYISKSIWPEVWKYFEKYLKNISIGSPENFKNFLNAVIDRKAFDKITSYIERARSLKSNQIIYGGVYDDSIGYFITPTVILTEDAQSITMREEIFGPVLTIYLFEDSHFDEILNLVDSTSPYALTGSVLARDRAAISQAKQALRNAAGNFYINDKPTGAVVGQQPFGGARKSGTNDKAGSYLNLLRWVSPRNIKENFNPPIDYTYDFMK